MEKNKTEQYTFGVNEKKVLNKLNTVESSVEQKLQGNNQRELISTKYYTEFIIDTSNRPVTLRNVFITAERNKQGEMSYHFRWIQENENGEQTIEEKIVVDKEGKVYAIEGLKDYLGNMEINIEDIMTENEKIQVDEDGRETSRLKGVSEKVEQRETEKNKKQPSNEENKETQEIKEDLKEQGQDLELTNIRKIKDPHIAERMPSVFGDSDEHAQAYSKKLGRFVMLEKSNQAKGKNINVNSKTGQWQINDKVEPANTTLRTIINIEENGKKIERKVPYALMKTNDSSKEIAVNIGQYGEINIETVDVLPCQERISRGVREEGEGLNKEESAEVRREFETQGKEYAHDLAHKVEEIEDIQRENNQIVDYEITESDRIPNTDITWGDLMERTGDSLPKLIERYNRDVEKANGKQDSKNIVENIIDDYKAVSHEHVRKQY